jgi:uncharacterized Zn finger protein (UPF0148 family)
MPRCEVCRNDYDKAFEVIAGGVSRYFDSIECAAKVLAPRCESCGCSILGHGVEADGRVFCCAHCARELGETSLRDRG